MGTGRLDRVRRGRAALVATGRDPIDLTKRTRMAHQDTTVNNEATDVAPVVGTDDPQATHTLAEVVRPWMRSDRAMLGTLCVLAAGWAIVLGRLIVLRHDRFGTFDFDEGIQDQLIWQLAHFRQFTTVRGVPFLGNHASFGFFLLAPLLPSATSRRSKLRFFFFAGFPVMDFRADTPMWLNCGACE